MQLQQHTSCTTRRGAVHPALTRCVLALLVLVLHVAPAWSAQAPATSGEPPPDAVVYVPIENGVVETAPEREAVTQPAEQDTGALTGAARSVEGGVRTVASVPQLSVPGTVIPVWWVLVMLLAVPLARWWRAWTARMFVA